MNYFELHIGDYQRKTAHLTLAEHGAYSLMLQTFYATERPLPADRKVLYKLLRVSGAAEKRAVDSIAAQFWPKSEAGLINKRAEEVLAAYRRWLDQQKANGKRGGRPTITHGLTDGIPVANPPVNPNITHGVTDGVTQTKPNGGDRARVPLPTPHLDHDLDCLPTPTPPKGGAVSRRRSPDRIEKDEARARWQTLIKTGGAARDHRVQAAIDAVGGWSRIQQRTEHDEPRLIREFCDAYREAAPA